MAKGPILRFDKLAPVLLLLVVGVFLLLLNLRSNPLVEHLKYYISLPLAPLLQLTRDSGTGWNDFLQKHRDVDDVYRRNEYLEQELARLKAKLADRRRIIKENTELRRFLGYKQRSEERLSLAYVLGHDTNIWRQALLIDVGAVNGLRKDTVCLGEGSIVGRVVQVNRDHALMMLVTDTASSISAVDARSEVRGVVSGAGEDMLSFDYLSVDADIKVGDEVLSSGLGGVYPRGYSLGIVTEIAPTDDRLNLRVYLRPRIDFSSLGHIFLLAELKRGRSGE